jgi:AcrR family transcriptional regulator
VPSDRRARRHQETLTEILDLADAIMREEGVNGLSLAEIARRLGVQPPSLYKYFPSLMAIYDALFLRGAEAYLAVVRDAMSRSERGLAAIFASQEAVLRWSLEHRGVAQLLFWRPVPSFEPSPEAFAPSVAMVALLRGALADAVAAGELGPAADSDDGTAFLSILTAGICSQAMANEPDVPWGTGRFTPLFPQVMALLPVAFPPATTGRRRARVQPAG